MPALVIVAERLIDGTGRDPLELSLIHISIQHAAAANAAENTAGVA